MINMAVNDEKETKHNYILYGLAIAILTFVVGVVKFIIDLYYNSNIVEYMKAIIVLIIFVSIGFVYIILEQILIKRELNRLKLRRK
jgi:uncharacterized membrane protein YcjF (UPF0283 family)